MIGLRLKLILLNAIMLLASVSFGQDVSTATLVDQVETFPNLFGPNGVAISADGTKIFVSENSGSNKVIALFELSTAYDISTAVYNSGVSVDLSGLDMAPHDLDFSADGTKLFIIASYFDGVSEFSEKVLLYSLSTGFDLSTASYVTEIDVTAQEDFTSGITLNNDGTKLFIIGKTNDSVIEYTMSTPYDLTNATASGTTYDVSAETTTPEAIRFSQDGNQLFVLHLNMSGNTAAVYTYDLPASYSIASGTTYAGGSESLTVNFNTVYAAGLAFGGTSKMYLTGANGSGAPIVEYSMANDEISPEVSITPALSITNATAFEVTFEFTEDVTGFDVTDIVVGNGAASNFQTTDAATYTADITPDGNGNVTIDVAANAAQDAAGNNSVAAIQVEVTFDGSAPTLEILNAPLAINDAVFSVTFEFSEDVTGFDDSDITLTNAALSNFQATDANTYTADITADGNGDITIDVAANVAQDAAANSNTAASQVEIVYDIVDPEVLFSFNSLLFNSIEPIDGIIAFSEAVVDFDLSDIQVSNGVVSDLGDPQPFIGTAVFYTFVLTPNSTGDIALNVAIGVVTDVAGNENLATSETLVYDGTTPTVEITSSVVDPTNVNPIQITITFTEAVADFEAADLVVGKGEATNLQTTDNIIFTADIIPTEDGEVTVDIPASVATDLAGNDNSAATQFSIQYDATSPTVVISSGENNPTNASIVSVTFTFSEEVSGFTIEDITVENGTAGNLQTTDNIIFTADISPTADGLVAVDLSAAVAQDASENTNEVATQFTIMIDTTAPEVTLLTYSGTFTSTKEATFQIVVVFSKEVIGLTIEDILVSNGTASDLTALAPFGDGFFTIVTITTGEQGDITISLPADAVTDLLGNLNEEGEPLVITFDTVSPTVAIQGAPQSINGTDPFSITIQFSEPVSGFTLADLTIGGGTAANLLPDDGNANVFTVDVMPNSATVTIDVAAETAMDLAQNTNTAAAQVTVTVDLPPAVEISGAPALTNNTSFPINIQFSESVTGFTVAGINVANGTASNLSGANDSYTADITPNGNGAISISIAAGSATDSNQNQNLASSQVSVSYDGTAPTISITGAAALVYTASPFTLTFTFSESVTGFAIGDITVGNGTASNFVAVNNAVFTANITPTAEGTVTVNLVAGVAQDAAGNGNIAATEVSVVYDRKYSGGAGTVSDPYLIGTEADLRSISGFTEDYDSYFTQIANINMGAELLTPIGNSANSFTGSYDGQGFNIDGIRDFGVVVIRFGNYNGMGLFGDVLNAELKNIAVTSIAINSTKNINFIGGLALYAESSTIENCSVTGSIISNTQLVNIGGLVGKTEGGTIANSFTDVDILEFNPYAVGGLIGSAQGNTTINNCYSISNLTITNPSQSDVIDNLYGGLIGEVIGASNLTITKSYYAGVIASETIDIGGLIAKVKSGSVSISNSFWDKELSGVDKSAGGGTGLTTFEMKILSTYTSKGWDFTGETANGPNDTWQYPFSYPILKWQLDRAQDFTISGSVVDENGNPFTAGTVKAGSYFSNSTADIDASGNFTLDVSQGIHSLSIIPDNENTYHTTYYGNTNNAFYGKSIFYNNSGIKIKMIAKSQTNLLDGNGRVSGRVVKSSNGGRITQGNILEGDPFAGVTVYLVRVSDGEIMTSVVTDENGDFEITGIPAGEYQLLLDVAGIDVNLEGSSFSMDEAGTPLVISAAVSEEGIVFGVEEVLGVEDQIELSVYPNPATRFVKVNVLGKASLRLIDINGRLITETSFFDQVELDVAQLRENIYILEIKTTSGVAVRKLIKQ